MPASSGSNFLIKDAGIKGFSDWKRDFWHCEGRRDGTQGIET
jgi:hypothetical protein